MRQLLINLLSNAVKFTPAGKVLVSVERLPGEGLRLRIVDTGIGIAPDRLSVAQRRSARASRDGKISKRALL